MLGTWVFIITIITNTSDGIPDHLASVRPRDRLCGPGQLAVSNPATGAYV